MRWSVACFKLGVVHECGPPKEKRVSLRLGVGQSTAPTKCFVLLRLFCRLVASELNASKRLEEMRKNPLCVISKKLD